LFSPKDGELARKKVDGGKWNKEPTNETKGNEEELETGGRHIIRPPSLREDRGGKVSIKMTLRGQGKKFQWEVRKEVGSRPVGWELQVLCIAHNRTEENNGVGKGEV